MAAARRTREVEVVDNPVVISFSEIDAFRQCPFKHHLAYQLRWSPDTEKAHLSRGTKWHSVLEARYHPDGPQKDKIAELLNYGEDATAEDELRQWMYEGYCEAFDREDEEWQFEQVEFKAFHPIPNPSGGPSRFVLKVKVDAVAVKGGRRWVWDHKTGKNMPTSKDFDFDDQFGLYMWLMQEYGYKIYGCMHNFARTQRNKGAMELSNRFIRTPLVRTPAELEQIAREAYLTAERMWPESPGPIPERNVDSERCGWRCDYTEACLMSRKGGRIADMLEAHGFSQRMFREVELEFDAIRRANT